MAEQVGKSLAQSLKILGVKLGLCLASVHLKCAYGCNDNHRIGLESRITALDIKEFFCAQVPAEACFGNSVIAKLHCHLGSDDRVTAVGDICKGTAVYDSGSSLQSLNQIGLQSVFKQSGHCACGFKIPCGNGLVLIGIAHNNAGDTLFKVGNILCEAEYRHNFGCNGYIVAVLTGNTVYSSAQTVGHEAELSVIHIHTAVPGNTAGVDIKGVALINMVIQHCGKKVVCCADSVEITGKVEVNILHRNYLRPSAACGAALYTENGAKGRLAQSNHNVFADTGKTVRKTDGGSCLSLTCGGGGHCRNKNKLAVFAR